MSTPSIETKIFQAIKARVTSLPMTDRYPIVWTDGPDYIPNPTRSYLRATWTPNAAQRNFIGSGEPHTRAGVLQIDVFGTKSQTSGVAREVAGQVAAHFPTDMRLAFEGVKVRVVKAPSVYAPFIETHIQVPVEIELAYEGVRLPPRSQVPSWLINLNASAAWGIETVAQGRSYLAGPVSVSRTSVGWARSLAGIWSPFAANVARRTDRGLTLEPAETNFAAYGTAPSTWSNSQPAGLSITKTAVTVDGLPAVRIQCTGTATAAGEIAINPTEFNAGAVAAQGETWRASARARLIAGTLPAALRVGAFERNASNGLIGQTYAEFTGLGASLQEARALRTLGDVAAARVTNSLRCAVANGQVVNFTIEITDAHLTQFQATSTPVLTTGTASATRTADALSLPIPAGKWNIHVVFPTGAPEQVIQAVVGPTWTPSATEFNGPDIEAIYGIPSP